MNQIKHLWKEVFDDTDAFLNLYFEKMYRPEYCLEISNADGKLCAALQMLPCAFRKNGETIPAAYIFAVMTAPDERNKGYMTQLINAAFDKLKQQGVALVTLIPQEEYLIDVYRKYGFEQAFRVLREEVDLQCLDSLPVTERRLLSGVEVSRSTPTIVEAYDFYTDYYKNIDGIQVPFAHFDFVCQSLINEGGAIISTKKENEITGLCLAHFIEDKLSAVDILANDDVAREALLSAIKDKFQAEKVVISSYQKDKKMNLLGMAKIIDHSKLVWTDVENAQMSLMMNE